MTFDDYDIDELAFDRALGKKMLRKKTRESIIDASFSRHAVEDEDLPLWFQDDEKKHVYKMEPITKEEFMVEKEKLLAINSKVPKKVTIIHKYHRSWSTRSVNGKRHRRR